MAATDTSTSNPTRVQKQDEFGFPVHEADGVTPVYVDGPDTFRLGEDDATDKTPNDKAEPMAITAKPVSKSAKRMADAAAEVEKNGKPKATQPVRAARAARAAKTGNRTAATAGDNAEIGVTIPKGIVQTMNLKDLTRDKRVQMRSSLFDESTVEEYRAFMKEDGNADRFPPVRVAELPADIVKELGLDSAFVVWDGFQRCEAMERQRIKEVQAEVIQGDWLLARRLAMLANRDHGTKRSKADICKLFEKFIADDALVSQVLAEGVGKGGANRAIAAAVGISKGSVNNYLARIGKGTSGGKIVNRTSESARPITPATTPRHDPASPKFKEDMAVIKAKHDAVLIQEMCNAMASFQRQYEAILEREDVANLVREEAKKQGYALVMDKNAKKAAGDNATQLVKTEYWPAVDYLLSIMDTVKEAHAATVTKTTTG